MVYRLSRLAAIAALGLAIARLGRLIQPLPGGAPWQIVLLAGAVLGATITWAGQAYGVRPLGLVGANALGILIMAGRLVGPDTTLLGILPTGDTLRAVGSELEFGLELVRFGSAPVLAAAGLIFLLGFLFWVFGALAVLGLSSGRPLWASAPPLLFYLQLATIDRRPSGTVWTLAFLLLVGLALASVQIDHRRSGPGRLRRMDGSLARRSSGGLLAGFMVVTAVVGVTGAAALAPAVPESGVANWRPRTGLGGGIHTGVSYNLFVSAVQQQLLSLTDEPVFVAQVNAEEAINWQSLYWRLTALEVYDGVNWFPGALPTRSPPQDLPFERFDHRYRGDVVQVVQRITIESLEMNVLPALYSPLELKTVDPLVGAFRAREDGSIRIDAFSRTGMSYNVLSELPNDSIATLASTSSGFSPLFQAAADAGLLVESPNPPPAELPPPSGLDAFRQLPADLDPALEDAARIITSAARSDLERALLLEQFFREDPSFTYSVDVQPGHAARDLERWLLDKESPNYRVGYCEGFATAMGVMARGLNMPTRVVLGFTPSPPENGVITVRQRNAHAWVEIWIENRGWVRFDPTPRGDATPLNPATFDRVGFNLAEMAGLDAGFNADEDTGPGVSPSSRNLEELENEAPTPLALTGNEDTGGPFHMTPTMWTLVGAAGAPLLLPLAKLVRRRRRLAKLRRGDIVPAWREIVDRLRDLGSPIETHETPARFADRTTRHLAGLASVYGRRVYGPDGPLTINELRVAGDAFVATERYLKSHYTARQRLVGLLSPRSFRPG